MKAGTGVYSAKQAARTKKTQRKPEGIRIATITMDRPPIKYNVLIIAKQSNLFEFSIHRN
ncbi:MAG: hypothetical protein QXS17_00895 [Candidatus Micrarchaeaceae archaeon]